MRSTTTSPFSFLFRFLLPLLVACGLLTGCSSSDDLQPSGADFAGSYRGKLVTTTKSGNQTFTQTLNDLTVEVKPASRSGTYTVQLFADSFGEISDPLTATASGNQLTLARQTTPGYPDDQYEGSGTLTGKTLALSIIVSYVGGSEVDTITATKP